MQQKFRRHVNSLDEIFDFIKSFINKEQLDKSLQAPLNLVIEEIFTNMVKYSSENPNAICLDLLREINNLKIVFTDYDVDEFDIRESVAYDTEQPLNKRPIGRIGLHLVKKYVDGIQYEYHDRTSKITLIKYIGKKHA